MKQALYIFALLLLTGCQSVSSPQMVEDKPSWIVSPERIGYIRVVGYAPKQSDGNEAAQYKVAIMKARQELAQVVRVRVQNVGAQTISDNNGEIHVTSNSTTRLSSKAAIRMSTAQVAAQWQDQQNGGLYLLLELPE